MSKVNSPFKTVSIIFVAFVVIVVSLVFTIKILLLSLNLYNSSGLYSQSYIVVCAVRGGQMVDQGPLRGCFLKNKDGTFHIMGSDFGSKEERDLCKNCIY